MTRTIHFYSMLPTALIHYSIIPAGRCELRIRKIKGTASGRVIEKQIDEICGEYETTYVAKDRPGTLKAGDELLEGSDVKTSREGKVEVIATISGRRPKRVICYNSSP